MATVSEPHVVKINHDLGVITRTNMKRVQRYVAIAMRLVIPIDVFARYAFEYQTPSQFSTYGKCVCSSGSRTIPRLLLRSSTTTGIVAPDVLQDLVGGRTVNVT